MWVHIASTVIAVCTLVHKALGHSAGVLRHLIGSESIAVFVLVDNRCVPGVFVRLSIAIVVDLVTHFIGVGMNVGVVVVAVLVRWIPVVVRVGRTSRQCGQDEKEKTHGVLHLGVEVALSSEPGRYAS